MDAAARWARSASRGACGRFERSDSSQEEINAAGTTIILTTHYLEEAEQLCDRIAIINHGRLIANEPTRQLVARAREKVVVLTLDHDIAEAPADPAFERSTRIGERVVADLRAQIERCKLDTTGSNCAS